jgi:uncharacterized membrane protein
MRLAVALAVCLLASFAAAQTYYADVTLDVSPTGAVGVSGIANHPMLQSRKTDAITSKRGSYWLFNLTLPANDTFSDYVFDVRLPDGAAVNYVKAGGQFRIATEDGRIAVRGLGKDQGMWVVIQYQIGENATTQPKIEESPDYPAYAAATLALGALAAYLVMRRRRTAEEAEVLSYDPDMLTDRQKDIMGAIKDAGRPVNQSVICERLKLPKSSVSRNVDSLERMNLITKTRTGMSTMLSMRGK